VASSYARLHAFCLLCALALAWHIVRRFDVFGLFFGTFHLSCIYSSAALRHTLLPVSHACLSTVPAALLHFSVTLSCSRTGAACLSPPFSAAFLPALGTCCQLPVPVLGRKEAAGLPVACGGRTGVTCSPEPLPRSPGMVTRFAFICSLSERGAACLCVAFKRAWLSWLRTPYRAALNALLLRWAPSLPLPSCSLPCLPLLCHSSPCCFRCCLCSFYGRPVRKNLSRHCCGNILSLPDGCFSTIYRLRLSDAGSTFHTALLRAFSLLLWKTALLFSSFFATRAALEGLQNGRCRDGKARALALLKNLLRVQAETLAILCCSVGG